MTYHHMLWTLLWVVFGGSVVLWHHLMPWTVPPGNSVLPGFSVSLLRCLRAVPLCLPCLLARLPRLPHFTRLLRAHPLQFPLCLQAVLQSYSSCLILPRMPSPPHPPGAAPSTLLSWQNVLNIKFSMLTFSKCIRNSAASRTFTMLCTCHHYPPPDPFHLPKQELCPH